MIALLLTVAGFIYAGCIALLVIVFIGVAISMFVSGLLGMAAAREIKHDRAAPAQPLRCDIYGNIIADDGLPVEPTARANLIRSKLASARAMHIECDAPDPTTTRYN